MGRAAGEKKSKRIGKKAWHGMAWHEMSAGTYGGMSAAYTIYKIYSIV
jgi:hypothetical protein